MDATRFDRIAKIFAAPHHATPGGYPAPGTRYPSLSRRQALATGGAGFAAAALATAGVVAASAQDATPEPATDAATDVQKIDFLFVQTFQTGTIAPVAGVDGRYTLTLEAGSGQTLYFSDRPDRIVGATPTPEFLAGLGFLPDNPPNAALVVETAPGETDIAVVELFSPLYDPVSQGVTYEVAVLADWEDSLDLGFREAPTDLAALAPAFGSAHLFIDDCPNETIYCMQPTDPGTWGGTFDDQAMCWNYGLCIPCEPYGHVQPDRCATQKHWDDRCNQTFPVGCPAESPCSASWAWWGSEFLCP